jgi:hypothetical protein
MRHAHAPWPAIVPRSLLARALSSRSRARFFSGIMASPPGRTYNVGSLGKQTEKNNKKKKRENAQ